MSVSAFGLTVMEANITNMVDNKYMHQADFDLLKYRRPADHQSKRSSVSVICFADCFTGLVYLSNHHLYTPTASQHQVPSKSPKYQTSFGKIKNCLHQTGLLLVGAKPDHDMSKT